MLVLLVWAAVAPADELPSLDCVITPYAMVEVASAVPGVLEAVHVDRSDLVEEGQVVAQLDSGVERAAVALAQARAAMDTDIHLQRANLAFDQREQERLSSLYAKKVASFHEKDKAERDAAVSRWKVRKARDLHRLRQLELRKAEQVLNQKTVTSPISGVVVQRLRAPGEYVEDQPILQIAQLHPLKVEAIVPMALFGQIRPGMQGEVMPETVSNGAYRATVTVVDRMGNAASGTFGVRLELPNPDYVLPAGQRCGVRFLPDVPPVTSDPLRVAPLASTDLPNPPPEGNP